jgi:hypothetical protein
MWLLWLLYCSFVLYLHGCGYCGCRDSSCDCSAWKTCHKFFSCFTLGPCEETVNWQEPYILCMGTLFYPTTCITLHSDRFTETSHHSPVLPFAMSEGPCGLFQSIAINVRFLLYFKKVLEVFFFSSQTHITPKNYIVYCTWEFYKLRELVGCFVIVNSWKVTCTGPTDSPANCNNTSGLIKRYQ